MVDDGTNVPETHASSFKFHTHSIQLLLSSCDYNGLIL